MRPGARPLVALAALVALCLAGCDRVQHLVKGPGFNTAELEAGFDSAIGGPDTCVVMLDTADGAKLYQYGSPSACNRPLAPCATFNAPMALIGLEEGVIKPDTVWPYDDSHQPSAEWRKDTDLAAAFQWGAPWWWARLAKAVGPDRFTQRLTAFGYGQGKPVGDPLAFWQGPAAGGGLFISTSDQAGFLRRLYRGALPVSPASAATVQGLMAPDRHGEATLSGMTGSCASIADNSRNLGWWVGRIAGSAHDVTFAISMEGQNALPGMEIRSRATPILQRAGLLPAA